MEHIIYTGQKNLHKFNEALEAAYNCKGLERFLTKKSKIKITKEEEELYTWKVLKEKEDENN